MKINEIKNLDNLIAYATLGRNITVKDYTPTPPPNHPFTEEEIKKMCPQVYLIFLYDTPISVNIGGRFYTPAYKGKYYISQTTSKWTNLLIKLGYEIEMDAFIEMVYEILECDIKGKNEPFIEDFIRRLR